MPEIKLQHVVSCSSEDKNSPAANLMKPEGTHKWKCAAAGEKQASVVLQFEKSSKIHSIDIGNEGSAFVEVLVGRSSATKDEDYEVILVASSFMSPSDSRNSTNRNSVRIFGPDKLSKAAIAQNWDRVKFVCTQPFNKTSAYGLSFATLHSPPEPGEKGGGDTQKPVQKLGAFTLKVNEEDDIKAGTTFANRGKLEKTEPPPLTGAAAVRAASRLSDEVRSSGNPPSTSSAAGGRTAESSKNTTPARATPPQPKRKHDSDTDEDVPPPPKPTMKKQPTSISSTVSSASSREEKPTLKKIKTEPPKESPVKAFGRLMEKVVFVLSGFQNPFRGELREMATEMGATYKPDWGKGCTHLVCAFPNTPKYNQVRGKGCIVKKGWISDCYKQKKLLPWKKYRLGDAGSPDESSDSDEYIPAPKKRAPPKKPAKTDIYGGDTESGEDTEEEVNRIKANIEKKKKSDTGGDPYGASTDEDENKPGPSTKAKTPVKSPVKTPVKTPNKDQDNDDSDSGLPDLPDFFGDKHFFFYGKISVSDRRLLTRYITAYDGAIESYMNDKVNYVITSDSWDKNFDDALSDNSSLVFVKPKWIHVCHEKNKLMPYQPYIIVPD